MVSWNIVPGLMLLAFVLPFIFLHNKIKSLSTRARNEHNTARQLRRMLAELEEHVRRDQSIILESLGTPFILMRTSGRIVVANQNACKLFGLSTPAGGNLLRALPDGELKQFVKQATESPDNVQATVRIPHPDGERTYHASASHLNTRERYIGIVFLDITEEHRTQIIRREFVSNASHELRTPLTLIMGYLEALIDDPETAENPAMRQRALGVMKRNADRMARLVTDMLMLSRVETPDSAYLKRETFDLTGLISEVLLRLEPMITAQHTTVEQQISPTPYLITGDSFYWSQVLFNLVENALKNNPDTAIKISITAVTDADGKHRITVQDDGVGIPESAMPYIFNRFYRADSTGKIKGTGLGLAIVKHAVEAHGGMIQAESTPGVRTAFTITLPPQATAAI